jgi:hypothetical protein
MRVLPLQRLHPDQDGGGRLQGRLGSNDRNGEMDIDGDGKPNEINMGCETCHGPGSVHDKAKEIDMPASIVSPNKLAAERSSDDLRPVPQPAPGQPEERPAGQYAANKMMLPGTSRNTYLKPVHHARGCRQE